MDPSSTGLVGHWRFDETSGLTALDNSGTGNDGALVNDPVRTSGQTGSGALSFDGVNDYVQVGAKANLVMSSGSTMSAWIYPTASTVGTIVSKEGEYILALLNGTLRWALANNVPSWQWMDTQYAVPLNQWLHVALVYGNPSITVYVNASPVYSGSWPGPMGDVIPSLNDVRIGGRQYPGNNEYFRGRIDEVRVYNRALQEAEIAALAQPSVTYVYGSDLISQTRKGATSYYGYDGHGSVRYLTGDACETSLVTSVSPRDLRNDHPGWLGVRFQVGDTPLLVSSLGRWVVSGNSASHTVKLVRAADGVDVPGGSVSVDTLDKPPGEFAYTPLAQPVLLAANSAYYLISQEFYHGDYWYDWTTGATPTGDVTFTGTVWADNNSQEFHVAVVNNRSFVPVSLKYSGASDTYTYDAFGTLISSTGTTVNNYRYTGEQWDPDLGMHYLRARYYHPDLGRFWTMDTFEGNQSDPLSLHKYLYAADNPANLIDPSGHENLGTQLVNMSIKIGMFTMQWAAKNPKKAFVVVSALSATGIFDGFPPGHPTPFDELSGFGRVIRGSGKVIVDTAAVARYQGALSTKAFFSKFSGTVNTFRSLFHKAFPHTKGNVWVHHAVEQQALAKYPGVVTEAEIHSLANLRGIPNEINPETHLKRIRDLWDYFYDTHPTATKAELLEHASKIDDLLGDLFDPPIR